MLLKALASYMSQIKAFGSKPDIINTFDNHKVFTDYILGIFQSKFDPISNRTIANKTISNKIADHHLDDEASQYLQNIHNSNESKILYGLLKLVHAILRTNYYKQPSKDYISFKFDSSQVPHLPLPIPYREIFVYSEQFVGIHLRGGKIARGGIRWSDRVEDYRSEALALMKAQMTKNAVIIPVGAKGVFVVNEANHHSEGYMDHVILCYKNFLRGLLDITDNIINSRVVHPNNVLIYDDADPYLVVAADKGTASFSDYANQISNEYNFWLSDAFASGGSSGYSHKGIGITAKGAWISAKTHLMAIGIDIDIDLDLDTIEVIGIGDMSGDVFGNGLLMSDKMKLIAAFNHNHIFIDPNPQLQLAFQERKRLFALPKSQWSDYNQSYISKGGGVFERSAKTIKISQEIQDLFGIKVNELTPQRLIQILLQAKVDLIWNGGIGTYIKASFEEHINVFDPINDEVRVNALDVNAKVIAEGGNLGVTQLGRIEYAMHGGRINTDFIDNSAGVDCSDHEVNIKIALMSAVSSLKLSIENRNNLLSQMQDMVERLVLRDNQNQINAIDVLEFNKKLTLKDLEQIIHLLEKDNLLNREIEYLPSKTQLANRFQNKLWLTRPEIAILLSYSKMYLYNALMALKPEFADFQFYLIEYFPQAMQTNFKNEITSNPLATEILYKAITNKIINELGIGIISLIPNLRLNQTNGFESEGAGAYMKYVRKAESRKIRLDHLKMGLGIITKNTNILHIVFVYETIKALFKTDQIRGTIEKITKYSVKLNLLSRLSNAQMLAMKAFISYLSHANIDLTMQKQKLYSVLQIKIQKLQIAEEIEERIALLENASSLLID